MIQNEQFWWVEIHKEQKKQVLPFSKRSTTNLQIVYKYSTVDVYRVFMVRRDSRHNLCVNHETVKRSTSFLWPSKIAKLEWLRNNDQVIWGKRDYYLCSNPDLATKQKGHFCTNWLCQRFTPSDPIFAGESSPVLNTGPNVPYRHFRASSTSYCVEVSVRLVNSDTQ
jgi:hypothetical protein